MERQLDLGLSRSMDLSPKVCHLTLGQSVYVGIQLSKLFDI
jgi:hypothetical protein